MYYVAKIHWERQLKKGEDHFAAIFEDIATLISSH